MRTASPVGFFNDPAMYLHIVIGAVLFCYWIWLPRGISNHHSRRRPQMGVQGALRRHVFGWKSQPAIQRVKQASSEIKRATRRRRLMRGIRTQSELAPEEQARQRLVTTLRSDAAEVARPK